MLPLVQILEKRTNGLPGEWRYFIIHVCHEMEDTTITTMKVLPGKGSNRNPCTEALVEKVNDFVEDDGCING